MSLGPDSWIEAVGVPPGTENFEDHSIQGGAISSFDETCVD